MNENIQSVEPLPIPGEILRNYPANAAAYDFIKGARESISNILKGKDDRLLVIVGPCSIHDHISGMEYARRLKELSIRLSDKLFIVMRTYFQKPRTRYGWKGLILEPNLDGKYNIGHGLRLARQFLLDVVSMEMPTATEILDSITPEYLIDLICWGCIGARTSESQMHRHLASGLPVPVGFKNSMDGNYMNPINSILTARLPQSFLGINQNGQPCAVISSGNPNCHIVLRGGHNGPNYYPHIVSEVAQKLKEVGLLPSIMIDCSHGNSQKDFRNQIVVLESIIEQLKVEDSPIMGIMIESHLRGGNQLISEYKNDLGYGLSVTDECIDWETTKNLLIKIYDSI